MPRDTIFRIASITKPITAAAAMMLVEECRLAAGRPGRPAGCPSWRRRWWCARPTAPLDDTVPARRPITVRDLLTFRLRLRFAADFSPARGPDPAGEPSCGRAARAAATRRPPDEWMRRLGTLPLMHQPGERVALQHRLRRARRAGRPRRRAARCRVPARADLRAARHARHRLPVPGRRSSTGSPRRYRPDRGRARAHRPARRPVEHAARLPLRRRRPGLDRRRPPGLRADAARAAARACSRRSRSR